MNTKIITKLTIKRSEWLRGEGDENSFLFRPSDGLMCCLGFFCIATNLNKESLYFGTPAELKDNCPIQLQVGANTHQDIIYDLMRINDNKNNTDQSRENCITKLMLQLNPPVTVTFVD